MSLIRPIKYWIPVVLWMAWIFWMSTGTFASQNTAAIVEPILRFFMPSIRQEAVEMIHGALRKLGHVSEYFVLGILLFRAFRSGSREPQIPRWVLSAFLILLLYAATDEFHQSFIATRTASLHDVGIDTLGGIVGLLATALPHFGLGPRR